MRRVVLFVLVMTAVLASSTAAALIYPMPDLGWWQMLRAASRDFLFGPLVVLVFWIFAICSWAVFAAEGPTHSSRSRYLGKRHGRS
jgi:hypothetical protein